MNLDPIITQIRAHCAVFGGRVAGAAQFQMLPETTTLAVPSAFVIPLADEPDERMSQNDVRQPLTELFGVIVALDNKADERGQTATATVHTVRAALWAALLGFLPTTGHRGIQYEGGTLLGLDRARLWWRFEFGAYMEIGPDDGWQGIELGGLPAFEALHINVDEIDPAADRSLHYPGPDGRIEVQADIALPQPPP